VTRDYKKDFPLFENRGKRGKPFIYFDNAATTQKPRQVIDTVRDYYENTTANPHRGAYALSNESTEVFESSRQAVADFIGAKTEEIVFTGGTTEAINLLSLSFGAVKLKEGDVILISIAEHHSNLLPWQRVARVTGAKLRYMYVDKNGRIPREEWEQKITNRTKIVALGHISNVLGSINPVSEIIKKAHEAGAVVLLDGAQSVPHIKIDVKELDVDFLAFSAHKMLGPSGIGVLYGKYELLKDLQPIKIGGGIVEEVTEHTVRYLDPPWRFEGGTPNVEGAAGLKAAIGYLQGIGMDKISEIENDLTRYALDKMRELPEIEIYGAADSNSRAGIISFNIKDVHPHDAATILDSYGVAIRAGHHCAQPLMQHLGVHSTCRISLYFYNTREEIDLAVAALGKVRGVLGYGDE